MERTKAWNRSSDTPPAKSVKKPNLWRGIGAGVLCLFVGALVLCFVVNRDEAPVVKPERRASRIKEVEPAPARTNKVEAAKTEDDDPHGMPTKMGQIKNGYIKLASGRLHRVKGVFTNRTSSAKGKYAIFSHPSENIIAGVLSIEPGQSVIGTPNYNGRFTKNFLESLTEPIIATAEDSEYERDLKRAVNQAKIELKAAYDRGEDIEKIILDARAECQKLAQYKNELRGTVLKEMGNCQTPEEFDDCVAAANKMLEAKGIAPMKELSALAKLKLQMKEPNKEEGK